MQRLTLTGGLRCERLEGYLPEQSSPPSVFYPTIPRSFAGDRATSCCGTRPARAPARSYDVTGDGKTAAKASYGRYYYVLSTGGGGVNNVNPNANYFTTYGWNDVNGDLKFQPGEQTGTPACCDVGHARRPSIRTSAGLTPTSTASASTAS